MLSLDRKVKKDLKNRFHKAEIAVVGILLFVLVFFPLAIFLAGAVSYLGFKFWQHKKGASNFSKRSSRPERKKY